MCGLYRSLTYIVSPLMPLWLNRRQKRGKEDGTRLGERFGIASLPRPEGTLLWVHAASVGESNAALPLIERLLAGHQKLHVLLTTGTVTSAAVMKNRLPERALHQFVPVDTPNAVRMFMAHWRPQIALFIDSELWPNLITEAHKQGLVMGLVNARMSESSFKAWRWARPFIAHLLSCFTFCFAQSKDDAERLVTLGIRQVNHIGNLKYDVPPLACDEKELVRLTQQISGRPVWLAASTHAGEEKIVASVHKALKQHFPDILTLLVPRHAVRADEIMHELKGIPVARRSLAESITPQTAIYLADTMGELGLFYRLSPIAFVGGSLVARGGQNPIEALRLGCSVVAGTGVDNFKTVYETLRRDNAYISVADSEDLVKAITNLLNDASLRQRLRAAGVAHVQAYSGSIDAIMAALQKELAKGGLADAKASV